ncbi:MAG TPA: hypothetical protein VGQ51_02500 [Puia sp.]|jgi:hypothetical protein|nr:hypothetical protein [Puia sp.]
MTTLVGIFFSLISLLGLFKGSSKRVLRRIVITAFCIFLVLAQVLFIYSRVRMESQQFIGFSGLLSGIILILSFQKEEAW